MSSVRIDLTKEEAIVLFDMLTRYSETDVLDIAHKSESQILWNLQADLESKLAEPLSESYKIILEAARRAISCE